MHIRQTPPALCILALGSVAVALSSAATYVHSPSHQESPAGDAPEDSLCAVDLSRAGMMADIVSNALSAEFGKAQSDVQACLKDAHKRFKSGEEVLLACADHFSLDAEKLRAGVERFRHVNCSHTTNRQADLSPGATESSEQGEEAPVTVTPFARDVILSVVLHELGHAVVREFDLPVLANEETLADAFATYYLTTFMPERAPAVLLARVQSLMVEAAEVPRGEWSVTGEHNSDARRAYQIAAVAVAADSKRYAAVAQAAGMNDDQVRSARDYGSEIHRSWRRILQPLWMPEGQLSTEAGVRYDKASDMMGQLCGGGLASELEGALRRFDWHSFVKISFDEQASGASWNRSRRTITVGGNYVRRFIAQGQLVDAAPRSGEQR